MRNKPTIIFSVLAGIIAIVCFVGTVFYKSNPESTLKRFYRVANTGNYKLFLSFFDAPIQKALNTNDQKEAKKRGISLETLYEERDIQLIEHYGPLEYEPIKTHYLDDNNVIIYQKVYKNGKLIGTYNQPMTKINGTWYLQQ